MPGRNFGRRSAGASPAPPRRHASRAPPRQQQHVFGAAALLIALVLVITMLLAWAGQKHPVSWLKKEWALLNGQPLPPPPTEKPAEKKEHTHVATENSPAPKHTDHEQHASLPSNPPPVITPAIPATAPMTPALNELPPVAPPANPADLTNAASVFSAQSDHAASTRSGGAARQRFPGQDVAEKSLDAGLLEPTGHAGLLRIFGRRDESQITPSTWTFYFFDKSAAGHARIVSVNNGKVIKTSEDLVDFASPYGESSILPEDQIQKDSTDALQVAQGLIPGVTVSSSEFTLLQQKNSVPMWKVALWTTSPAGEQHRLGEVTLLAQNGTVILNSLKQP